MGGLCVRCWVRSPDVCDIWAVCLVVGLLSKRKIRLFYCVVTSFNARGYRAGDCCAFSLLAFALLDWLSSGQPPTDRPSDLSLRLLRDRSCVVVCWTSRTNATRKSSRKLQVVGILNHLRRSSIRSSEENEPVNEPVNGECAGVAKNRQGYRRNESEVEEESANSERRSQSSVSENKSLAGGNLKENDELLHTETETEIQREEEQKESVRERILERRGKSQGQGSRGENEKAEGGRYTEEMAWWDGYISDDVMGTIAPLVVYWLYAGLYHMLPPLDRFRLHSVQEEEQRNLVTLPQVVKGVLLQQAVQAVVAFLLFASTGGGSGPMKQPSLVVQAAQVMVAMLVMDTWQYFIHRLMHINKFLYKHIHSQHHRLVVPYAFGALYNHPLEGLLLDTIGGAISFLIAGMTPRTAIFFFSFATVKTVDDHCGLWLPGNPFHLVFHNNTAYHDIHHQLHGTKYNFSQPFFLMWDKLLGTHMPYVLQKRADGGLEARPLKPYIESEAKPIKVE